MKWLILIFTIILGGCTLWNGSKSLEKDLNMVCAAQKSYLQTAKLSGVNQAELWAERARKMRQGLLTDKAKEAVDLFLSPGPESHANVFFELAREEKVKDWTCPELQVVTDSTARSAKAKPAGVSKKSSRP